MNLDRPSGGRLLIVGGSGFFGKSILDSFLRGHLEPLGVRRLTLVARSHSGLGDSRADLTTRQVNFVAADIETCEQLPDADFVIHAATSVNFAAFKSRPVQMMESMVASADNFARIARKQFVESRVVYVSSGAAYGDLTGHSKPVSEEEGPFDLGGLSPEKAAYAEGKRWAEGIVTKLGDEGLCVSVVRAFTFFGRHLPDDKGFAIADFISQARAGLNIRLTRTQPVYRSYLDADDLSRWLVTIAVQSKVGSDLVNVGSMESLEMLEVAELVASEMNVGVDVSELQTSRADWYIPDTTKAQKKFGLVAKRTLQQSLRANLHERFL